MDPKTRDYFVKVGVRLLPARPNPARPRPGLRAFPLTATRDDPPTQQRHEHSPKCRGRPRGGESRSRRRLALARSHTSIPRLRLVRQRGSRTSTNYLRRPFVERHYRAHATKCAGRRLAATQVVWGIGGWESAASSCSSRGDDGPKAIANPVVVSAPTRAATVREACLPSRVSRPGRACDPGSSRGKDETAIRALRSRRVRLALAQHELDHLDGGADHRPTRRAPQEALATLRPRSPSYADSIGRRGHGPLGADVLERLAEQHEIAFLLTGPTRRWASRKVAAPPGKGHRDRARQSLPPPESRAALRRRAACSAARTALYSRRACSSSRCAERAPRRSFSLARARAVGARHPCRDDETRRDDPRDGEALDAGPSQRRKRFAIGRPRRG